MVRGKWKLSEIHQLDWSPTAKRYVFNAVCNDNTPENERYHKFTPTGSMSMIIDNPPAQAQFELGKEYFFDATPACGNGSLGCQPDCQQAAKPCCP